MPMTRHGPIEDRKKFYRYKLLLGMVATVVLANAVFTRLQRGDAPTESGVETICISAKSCFDMVTIPKGDVALSDGQLLAIKQDYKLGKFEVTQGLWMEVMMKDNPSRFIHCGSDCPVEQISVADAKKFLEQLNVRTGRSFRLPTEKEWLYAAASLPQIGFYVDSPEFGGVKVSDGYAWLSESSGLRTHPVAQLKPTGHSLYDLIGNVREWVVQDCGLHRPLWRQALDTITGQTCSTYISMGGGWLDHPDFSHPARRYEEVLEKAYDVGLRLALTSN